MSIDHTLLSKSTGNWNNRLKGITLIFQAGSNIKNLWFLLSLEVSCDTSDSLDAIFEGSLKLIWVELVPLSLSPSGMSLEPSSCGEPKLRIWLELLAHHLKSRVVFLFFSNQEFS